MKYNFPIVILLSIFIPTTADAVYDQRVEKNLKKEFKDIVYLAHNDCYKVMSKSDKGYYGICDSEGKVIIPPTYKKFSFEKSEDDEAIIFALDPNFRALSTGNIVYSTKRGKILDMGRSEPQYIPGGYISSYGKPIYDLSGQMVLDCEQTATQPIRDGKEIIAYRVACRSQLNNQSSNELLICDADFHTLFSLDGIGYLWKIDLDKTDASGYRWKCTKSTGANEATTLIFNQDGSPLDDQRQEHNSATIAQAQGIANTKALPDISGKELKVDTFEIDPMDLSGRTNSTSRIDGNGRKCAILKIYTEDQIVEAQGNVIGDIRRNGMEHWIYLAHDSKHVKLIFASHYPLLIKFIDYNFPTVSEQMTYVVKLK